MQGLLLQQTCIMFILIGIGYLLTKVKMLSLEGSKELSTLLMYVALPAVVVDSFLSAGRTGARDLGMSFLLAAIGLVVSMAVSFLIYGTRKGIDNFGASFGNAGFMGIPLVVATFGDGSVIYVAGAVALLSVLQWTYGVMIITKSTESIKINKLLKNPVIVSVFVGLVLMYLPFQLPEVIMQPLSFAKGMNTPLAMIIVGISLAQTSILDCLKKWEMYQISIVRLIIIPLVTMAVFRYINFVSRDMLLAMMVVLSTPIGSSIAIVAQVYNADAKRAVQQVCFTTLLSIITIPIVMGIVENFL